MCENAVVSSSDGKHDCNISRQLWFHGPLNSKIAISRLLNNGSFLVTCDEDNSAVFHLFMKWNGKCFSTDINYNMDTKKYNLGSVERNDIVDLINYYQKNQLPIRDDIGAILFVPVVAPRFSKTDEPHHRSLPSHCCETKEFGMMDSQDFYQKGSYRKELGSNSQILPAVINRKLNRRKIRYLPMDEKPLQYKDNRLNKSLGNLASIYCDPSNFRGSTLSLPISTLPESDPIDTKYQRLTQLCRGFINYDFSLFCLATVKVTKPLDVNVIQYVGKILFNAGIDIVSTCLAIETSSILLFKWLPTSGSTGSLPSDGYSLLLWPAANGYRRDLFNRSRFLSLFLTASIVIQKEPALKAALLALWMGVIERLTGYHKDFFTANALINGICVSQICNDEILWEKAFSCESASQKIDQMKQLLSECQVRGTPPIEMAAACLTQINECVPNIAPLLEDLYQAQSPNVNFGGLPPPSMIEKLSVAKGFYRRVHCGKSNELWVAKRWPELQVINVPEDVHSIFKTENLMLLLLGPVDMSNNEDLEEGYKKVSEVLSLLSETSASSSNHS